MRNPHTGTKSNPLSPQLEKAGTAKNKYLLHRIVIRLKWVNICKVPRKTLASVEHSTWHIVGTL